MNIEAEIGTPADDSEDFDYRDGRVVIEAVEADRIVVRFMVGGEQVALAGIDRFQAGVIVGSLVEAAREALPA